MKYKYEEVKSYIENNSNCKLLSTNYKNGTEKLKLKCECGNIYYQNFYTIRKQEKIQCQSCSKKNADIKMRRPKEDVLNEIYSKIKNDYELLDLDYNGMSKSYVTLKHKKCGYIYKRNLKGFLNRKVLCPHCESKCKKLTLEDVQNELDKNNKNFKVLSFEKQERIELIHEECGCVFTRSFHCFKGKTIRCPSCQAKISTGALKISKRLDLNKINYITEYKFKECRDSHPLPFDFYLEDYNIAIEFDGIQHDEPVKFYGGEEKFKIRQKHDKMKTDFCKDNNIQLIRIKHFQIQEIEKILEERIPR